MSSLALTSLGSWTKSTIQLFFEPLFDRKSPYQFLTSSQKAGRKLSDKNVTLALDLVSYNQPKLIEYIYLSSQKHKALRIATSSTSRQEGVKEIRDDLIKFLNARFFASVSENFSLIHRYFRERQDDKPRVCIKGGFKTEDRDAVITIFRDSEVPYADFSFLDQNTALSNCVKTGRYFISNDVVGDVARRHYINPRIDSDLAFKIMREDPFHPISNLRRKWLQVWNHGSRRHDAFQSSLVIPIALSKAQLSDEFIRKLAMEKVDRIIFGFLCIDHSSKDYFLENEDVPFCYAVADLLSLFAFTRLQFTDFSSTFSEVDEAVNEAEIMDTISAAVKGAVTDAKRRSESDNVFEVEETEHNRLVADESLVDFLIKANPGTHRTDRMAEAV